MVACSRKALKSDLMTFESSKLWLTKNRHWLEHVVCSEIFWHNQVRFAYYCFMGEWIFHGKDPLWSVHASRERGNREVQLLYQFFCCKMKQKMDITVIDQIALGKTFPINWTLILLTSWHVLQFLRISTSSIAGWTPQTNAFPLWPQTRALIFLSSPLDVLKWNVLSNSLRRTTMLICSKHLWYCANCTRCYL